MTARAESSVIEPVRKTCLDLVERVVTTSVIDLGECSAFFLLGSHFDASFAVAAARDKARAEDKNACWGCGEVGHK